MGQLVSVHVIPRPHDDLGVVAEDDELPESPLSRDRLDFAMLEQMKVVELRTLARRMVNFPLKGRDVARAGRDELLSAFRSLKA